MTYHSKACQCTAPAPLPGFRLKGSIVTASSRTNAPWRLRTGDPKPCSELYDSALPCS